MSEDETLAQHFKASAEAIHELRLKDQEFDAMCEDFLELSNRAVRVFSREHQRKFQHLADLAETISGLAEEIDDRLRKDAETESRPTDGLGGRPGDV